MVALFLLTGCGTPSPYPISKGLLLAVLVSLKQSKKLQFGRGEKLGEDEIEKDDDALRVDRERGFFIFRRTLSIGARNTGFTESQLVSRVQAQYDVVEAFVQATIGPSGKLFGYAEPDDTSQQPASAAFIASPSHHFDLSNIAILKKDGTSRKREAKFLKRRHVAVRSIVWRAAALNDRLWSSNGDGATLNTAALQELLDRRLRAVERMTLQVNGGGIGPVVSGGTRGPWADGSRVRVFEYPYFAKSLVDPADIWDPSLPQNAPRIFDQFDPETVIFNWHSAGRLATRFEGEPGTPATNWVPASGSTYQRLPGTGSIAAGLRSLFESKLDIWQRSWLFCDHSIAAIHLESLLFAMQRRGQGSQFDTLVRPKFPYLAGLIGGVDYDASGQPFAIDRDTIYSDGTFEGAGDTGVFDNLFADVSELQTGDHIILWNHHMYVSVNNGPWRLENAFVTDVDVVTDNWDEEDDPIDPAVFMKPQLESVGFSGFGESHDYQTFLRVLFAQISGQFNQVFTLIPTTGDAFFFNASIKLSVVVKWAPYQTGIAGDPWFIFLPRQSVGDPEALWPDVTQMHEAIRHSVIDRPGLGGEFRHPPTSVTLNGLTYPLTDGVFFPLFTPLVDGLEKSWDMYIDERGAGSGPTAELDKMRLGPEVVPGLFTRGKQAPIQILRPRVRP